MVLEPADRPTWKRSQRHCHPPSFLHFIITISTNNKCIPSSPLWSCFFRFSTSNFISSPQKKKHLESTKGKVMIDSPILNLIQSVNCPRPTLVSAAIWKHESAEKFRLLNLRADKHEPTWREIPVSWTWITYAVSLPFMLSRGTGFHDKSTLCCSIVAESTVGDADGTGIIQKDEHWQWKSHVVTS